MQWDAISKRARDDLTIITEQGEPDVFLWEHCSRVARYARWVVRQPEVRALSPDEPAVIAGALYHDAGWIVRLQEKEIRREHVLISPMSERHFELGAAFLERRLENALPPETIRRAAQAVRALQARRVESIDGQVIAEADSLDEAGLVSLWRRIRRATLEGKGIQAELEMWKRKSEFGFWEAWLNNVFRFPVVRRAAVERLKRTERFLHELSLEHEAKDLP